MASVDETIVTDRSIRSDDGVNEGGQITICALIVMINGRIMLKAFDGASTP